MPFGHLRAIIKPTVRGIKIVNCMLELAIQAFTVCHWRKTLSIPNPADSHWRGWGWNCRGNLGQLDPFNVQKFYLDFHRQEDVDVLDGFFADHVSTEEGVDGVAPVVEGLLVGRHQVYRRGVVSLKRKGALINDVTQRGVGLIFL